MKHVSLRLAAAHAAAAALCSVSSAHDVIGVLADRGAPGDTGRSPFVHVFDPATLEIEASIPLPIPAFSPVFDVEIAPDLGEAYVSDFNGAAVWVVDLDANPPALAAGVNPIDLAAATTAPNGEAAIQDLAVTRDGRFLVAGTGNGLFDGGSGFAVVDLSTRAVTDSVDLAPGSPIAVATSPDGSVIVSELVESSSTAAVTNVRRYRLTHDGRLIDTGEVAGADVLPGAHNVLVPSFPFLPRFVDAFVSRSVVHVSRPTGQTVGSLDLHGLAASDERTLVFPTGIDLNFDPLRRLLYVRSNEQGTPGPAGAGNGRIDVYGFRPFRGRFGGPILSIPLDRKAGTAFGSEQTAIDPLLRRVYVSGLGNGEVRVFDSLTGEAVGTITNPDFLFGLGIRVRRAWH
ncbi:MAG: hypothetical protein AAGB93_22115 [Planctomycetota bacterium]